MYGLAHGVVAAERERHVADAAADHGMRQTTLDIARRLDEIDGVAVVLFDAGRDGEDIGIEDDVFRRKSDLLCQNVVRPLANLELPRLRVRLAVLVEGHDDDRRAVLQDLFRLGNEGFFTFFQADRIDHALALHALQAVFDDRPFRRIDHDRHARDIRLRGNQIQECLDRRFCVEHGLIHVDIDDLCAVLHLLARDIEGGLEFALHDQLLETRRSGHVRTLADINEPGDIVDRQRLQAAQPAIRLDLRQRPRRDRLDCPSNGGDVRWLGAATSADDVEKAAFRELAELFRHIGRRVVIAAEGVGQTRVGVDADVGARSVGDFLDMRPQILGPERAVQSNRQGPGMRDGIPECLGRLTR